MILLNFLRKETIDAKAIMYALLPLLLLHFSSLAGAVSIVFFNETDNCDKGLSIGCYAVDPFICCEASAAQGGSVLITKADDAVLSLVYAGGNCSTFVGTKAGRGNTCNVGGGYTGARWYPEYFRRSLLADPSTCDTQMKPNSVFFTENSTEGHWILTTPNVDQLYSEVHTVPDAERANWVKSRGAIYDQL